VLYPECVGIIELQISGRDSQAGIGCWLKVPPIIAEIRTIFMTSKIQTADTPLQRGFTLIEIMVVVVILGILAALIAPNVISRIDDAQIVKVQQDIRAMESALKLYRLDNFRYPETEEGLDALVTPPQDPDARWPAGGYLDRLPKDPWERDYVYLHPGNQAEFDIYTLGRDGQQGGEGLDTDVGNWSLN
jgi:general secretion pathway protein G